MEETDLNISFVKLNDVAAKNILKELYYQEGYFFKIIYNFIEIGVCGFCVTKNNLCSLDYLIFPEFRNKQTKSLLLSILNFPRHFGFIGCVMITKLKKVSRILTKFKKYGVIKLKNLDEFDNYDCFLLEYES